MRYVTGQGNRVLARRANRLRMPPVMLAGPDQVAPGTAFTLESTGPAYARDYLTSVPRVAPDAQSASHADPSAGSPARLTAPRFELCSGPRFRRAAGEDHAGFRNHHGAAPRPATTCPP